MTVTNARLVDSQFTAVADTPEIFYTSPARGKGTVVTNFTATNSAGSPRTYKAYIVSPGGTADTPIVPERTINSNDTDLPAEIAAQFMPPGFTLQMESDTASSISFSVSGREFS